MEMGNTEKIKSLPDSCLNSDPLKFVCSNSLILPTSPSGSWIHFKKPKPLKY